MSNPRLLLFSDLHNDLAAARSLVERAEGCDIVVGAGDFCNARRNLRLSLDILRAIDRPTVLVAGNNETTEELRDACREWDHAHVLHGSGVRIEGVDFFGLGGGIPVTPFGPWSYDFSEEMAVALLAGCPAGGVLVSHSPPKGTVDRDSRGRSLGSVAVRDAILRCQPVLVVCGHIHGSASKQALLGTSTVINAGPDGIEWQATSATPERRAGDSGNR